MSLSTSFFCSAKNASTSGFFRFFKSCNHCRSLFALSFFDPLSTSSSSSSLSSPVYGTSANLTMDINSKSALRPTTVPIWRMLILCNYKCTKSHSPRSTNRSFSARCLHCSETLALTSASHMCFDSIMRIVSFR